MKRHVIGSVFTQARVDAIWIPIIARDGEVIPAAFIAHGFLPAIGCRDRELFAGSQRFGENHRKVRVVIFVFLDERKGLAVCGHGLHAEGVEQGERHHAQAIAQ